MPTQCPGDRIDPLRVSLSSKFRKTVVPQRCGATNVSEQTLDEMMGTLWNFRRDSQRCLDLDDTHLGYFQQRSSGHVKGAETAVLSVYFYISAKT